MALHAKIIAKFEDTYAHDLVWRFSHSPASFYSSRFNYNDNCLLIYSFTTENKLNFNTLIVISSSDNVSWTEGVCWREKIWFAALQDKLSKTERCVDDHHIISHIPHNYNVLKRPTEQ